MNQGRKGTYVMETLRHVVLPIRTSEYPLRQSDLDKFFISLTQINKRQIAPFTLRAEERSGGTVVSIGG